MGKNKDLVLILLIVLIGMFIPFLVSIYINYGFDMWKISSTFGYFLLIFALEIITVYLYFTITGKIASKKLENYKSKNK